MPNDFPPILRETNGRFAKGGSGRPFGARSKVSRRVANAILADFEANKGELLPRLREWFLPTYVALVGRLMPRDAGDAAADEVDPAAAAQLIAAARAALDRIEAGEGTLADLEAALAGEPAAGEGTDTMGDYR